MIKETFGAMRDLSRMREISAILIRHGLGEFVQRLKLPRAVEIASEWLHMPCPALRIISRRPSVRVWRWKPSGLLFIKLGQILLTRVDVFRAIGLPNLKNYKAMCRPYPKKM